MADKEVIQTQNQIEEPKSSLGAFDLPCGVLGPDGELYTGVQLREITGVEEDILISNTLSLPQRISRIIGNCLQRVGPYTDRASMDRIAVEMLSGDRVYVMIGLRRVSLGDQYPIESKCPACKKTSYYEQDLSTLERKAMRNPKVRLESVTISGKREVMLRCLSGVDEERMAKLRMPNEMATLNLLFHIVTVAGEEPTLEGVQNLSMNDRNTIRDFLEEKEGGVDTSLEFDCPACGENYQSDVDLLQRGFFSPAATRKALKKKYSFSWSGSKATPTKT